MSDQGFVTIDGRKIPIEGERNLLELIRKARIDLPTFCYHSDLSVYGACRLCLVDVAGRGIQGACSTPPEPGLELRTGTDEIREIRRITVELLLANHDMNCPTCPKSNSCQLQSLARKLGVREVRFKSMLKSAPLDCSSPSLIRDPNRCVLCGDCVRACTEIQGLGAIDFAWRGADAAVVPAFGKGLDEGECVNCGQCAAVCPTGALIPRSEVEEVWKELSDPNKVVVAQLAPAVQVALGEYFGLEPGTTVAGQAVAALRAMGFDHVYDTAFGADLTVLEEANEFLGRVAQEKRLPQFTSCCPAWVKFAEQQLPEMLPNLSSCRSPQQMLGSLAREILPAQLGIDPKNLVIVSVMPCTAKKFEARREEFSRNGQRDVDYVVTTHGFARMIEEAGLRFRELTPSYCDTPIGFKTGAGILFGTSGGVTEAVLRYVAKKLSPEAPGAVEFAEVRGEGGVREAVVKVAGKEIRLAIVQGLKNARDVAERVAQGERRWDLIEVMACPGGCIGGAGQPVASDARRTRRIRTEGIYSADRAVQLHRSQENPFLQELYRDHLGEIGGHKAHGLLHTHYHSRRRIPEPDLPLAEGPARDRTTVKVCVGTSCFVKGSQAMLKGLLDHVENQRLEDTVDVRASFCFENCAHSPSVSVDGKLLQNVTLEKVLAKLEAPPKARG